MVKGDNEAHKILEGASVTVVGWHGYWRGRGAHKIFHGASTTTVVGWHGYERGQGLITNFTQLALLWLAGTVMGEVKGS